jgi:hypothetical protein
MRGKLLLVIGLATGYVLGTRAGRERYEDIKRTAGKLWHDPRVQQQVKQAEDFAKDKAPEVVDFISDGAKKVASQVSGSVKAKTGSSASKSPSSTTPSSTTPSSK